MASEGRNLVGLDIGSHSLKLCEIEEPRKGPRRLVRFGYHPLPAEAIVDGQIRDREAVIDGLEKLFHKSSHRDVAIRVSGHRVIIKKIVMPLMNSTELAAQINWEAEQHIPFAISDVQIDYDIVRQRPEQGQMDVLLVAAKKEDVASLMDLAKAAKLRPRVIDVDAFCVQNCYETGYGPTGAGRSVVLVHTGASLTTLNILADGSTAFTRDLTQGGQGITDELQRMLGLSAEEAETLKCKASDGAADARVMQAVEQSLESLAGEIQRSLDFFLATSGFGKIDTILVSGGTSNSVYLLRAIERRAGAPVERLDPFRAAAPDAQKMDIHSLHGRVSQSVVAMGLALRKDKERRA